MDQKVNNGFFPVLTYAACEWFLIFLMFIDALLSYLLFWFARYCKLQTPCFLCSKFLHPLHWRFSLCRNHKSEISSFMSCRNHDNNLADCRGMCDDCLLSFTKMSGPNLDMNRLLLGKLGYDLLSKTHFVNPRSCSCCNKPWRTRQHTQRLIQLGSRGRNSAGKPNIPAPRHLTRRGSGGSLMNMREHKPKSGGLDHGSRSDGMAYVGYTELKINSDSESDFLVSEDDRFLQIINFNGEPFEKRVHKSRSRKPFEGKKMSKRKQNKRFHEEDNEPVESAMAELKQPVEAEDHEAVLSELITMSEARPFLLGLHEEDDAEKEAEVSNNSSSYDEEFLSPSGRNITSREIQIQDLSENIFDSALNREGSEADMEEKVTSEDSSDEENGDSKLLTSSSHQKKPLVHLLKNNQVRKKMITMSIRLRNPIPVMKKILNL